ncbi:MAG: type IX secretion system membrane protein PorP/SprF [Flavobacteriales bacterium]|nr:type IX secretion system membrane protein PorP/SprF [Flavobacteriales bacterium]
MKKAIFIIFLLLSIASQGQQYGIWNQSLFNYYNINSAYAGSKNTSSLGLSYRNQWSSIEGAPTSQYITFHTSLKDAKMGLGLNIRNESIGIQKSFKAEGAYAYHIKTSKGSLSFALDASIMQNSYSFSELELFETDQKYDSGDRIRTTDPGFGFSVLYQSNYFIGGLRAFDLISSELDIVEGAEAREYVHFDLILGSAKRLSKKVVLKPFAIINAVGSKQISYSFSSNFTFNNILTVGGGYRNDKNVNLLLHFFVRNNLRIGYSYEMGVINLIAPNLNTHELFMGINTGKESGELVSPRFYDL